MGLEKAAERKSASSSSRAAQSYDGRYPGTGLAPGNREGGSGIVSFARASLSLGLYMIRVTYSLFITEAVIIGKDT